MNKLSAILSIYSILEYYELYLINKLVCNNDYNNKTILFFYFH